jgi:hypothetical protein
MADDPTPTPDPAPAGPEAASVEAEPSEPDVADRDDAITAVNGQITDAVTQANATVLGEAPGLAMALVHQSLAQAMSLAFLNATQQQQQANMIAQAATAAVVARLLGQLPPEVEGAP